MSEIQMIKNNESNIPMSNISKDTNRFQMPYNSIQRKLDRFWDNYSKFLIRYSFITLILSSLITIGLTVYFFNFVQIRHFDETAFFMRNGRTSRNIERIKNIFGNDKNFRAHQQMNLYPALDVIIKRKSQTNRENMNETNMLNQQIIDEVRLLDQQIQSIRITISNTSFQYNYSSLCAIMNHACIVDGNYLLSDRFRQDFAYIKYESSEIYFDTATGANGIAPFIFSRNYQTINATSPDSDYVDESEGTNDEATTEASLTEIISYVPLFRLRYSLNITTDETRRLSAAWENEAINYLNEKFQSRLISVAVSSSTAISDTVSKQASDEGPFIAIMLLIFFIFVCFFISVQGTFHTSVGYLSACGIISLILSSGATFGLLSLLRVQIMEPMALIVFVIAIIECMRVSIICGDYHRIIEQHLPQSSTNVSTKIDIEKILSSILKSSRPYFLSSTLIQMIVFIIMSIISPMPCPKYLSITLVVYVFINYLTHCTFFSSCLIITLKRIKSRRHSLSCLHLPSDYYIKDRKKSIKNTFFQLPMKLFENIDPKFKRIFTGFICLFSIIFVICSLWLILSIDTRLFDDRFLPRNSSSLRSYMKSQTNDYDIGPVIMFVIPQTVDYTNATNRLLIHRMIEKCQNETTTNKFKLVWIDHEDVTDLLTSKDSIDIRITPYSQNDIILSEEENKTVLKASRFYCQYKSIKGDREDLRTMNNLYTYTQQSPIPFIFPFSLIFQHYEALGQIRLEMYLLILIMVTITFVAIFLIFASLKRALLIILHLLVLLSGSLACLYLFHNLSFNFANAPWLYIIPIVYLDTIIHATFNMKKTKWKYNRIMFSLIIALIIFSFFPIETYIFHIICYSLLYQSLICVISINILLPSWFYIIKRILKQNKKTKKLSKILIDTNQSSAITTEIQNLVNEPNGNMNNNI
ncbi:unnamed protein product [Rotaria magnacalcarata]|uniref:SSD domain-containing protein n=2 Tax=Rotaria magnacalcarata TaxID=392030 RepID=A0A816M7V5_9BILA|nr:unnamed protein product [Rotaria magnacalcarata]